MRRDAFQGARRALAVAARFLARWFGLPALLGAACSGFGPDDVSARWEVESVNGVAAPGRVPVFTRSGTDTLDVRFDQFRLIVPGEFRGAVPCVRAYTMDGLAGSADTLEFSAHCAFTLGSGDPPVTITITFQPEHVVPGHPLVGSQTVVGRIDRDVMTLDFPVAAGGQTNSARYRRAGDP